MTPLLTYFAKVVVCSAVLYAYYYIALRNHRFHQWNRYYLVLITIVSLLTPLLQIPLPGSAQEPSAVLSYTARIITLRESVIPTAGSAISVSTVIHTLYMLLTCLLLARVMVSLFRIRQLIFRSQVQEVPPYHFVAHPDIKAPFSFFTYIFWDQQTPLNSPEGQQILKHELVHVREKHSADKLFMEIITAACWINPFFHLIKRELALVHEFLADKKAAEGEVAGYAQTILQMAFQSKQFSLTNNFFHPPIKRRILMLTQFHTPRFSYLRRILALPLVLLIFCSLAFVADKRPSAIRALTATPVITAAPVMATAPVTDTTPVKKSKSEIFTVAEQRPQFQGGEEAMAKYISKNIRYPEAAQQKGVSGTVFVQYVIDQDGNIQDVHTVGKNPGFGLHEEAVRLVKTMPKWVPGRNNGKAVPVQFTLPIRFVLEHQAPPIPDKPATAGQPANIVFQPADNNEIFTFVEQPPQFPGGEEQLAKYLNKNIRYPETAQKAKTSGTIFVQFVVMSDGNIKDIKTVGPRKGNGLEEESIRVVNAMPRWTPGMQHKQPVSTQYSLPIRFVLNN